MEKEQRHYELRSRSRSRSHTPKGQNSVSLEKEQVEHHYDLRSNSRSRSHTPGEVTSSRRSTSRSLTTVVNKVNEGNTQVTNRKIEETASENASPTSTKKAERRSERQRAKKQEASLNRQGEIKDDAISDSQSERNRKSVTPQRLFTSDYSSEEGDREDPPSRPGSAYEIYKRAGDWWNKFPKTDYTYSQKSQYRYEIAPGILAMPNMSRRPIHSNESDSAIDRTMSSKETSAATSESALGLTLDSTSFKDTTDQSDTVSSMEIMTTSSPKRSTHLKEMHSERYTSYREVIYTEGNSLDLNYRRNWSSGALKYDSDTELDEAMTTRSSRKLDTSTWTPIRWSRRLSVVLVAWFFKVLELVKFGTSKEAERHRSYHYYGRNNESRWRRLWKYVDHTLQNVYFSLAKIFLLDCWLLSRLSDVRRRAGGKNAKIAWIILLPLLFLAGCWAMLPNISLFRAAADVSFSTKGEDLSAIINKLSDRIQKLERGNSYKSEYLTNESLIVRNESACDSILWQSFNDKINNLEKKLGELEVGANDNGDVVAIKSEFHRLRELYSELRSYQKARADVLAIDDIRMEVDNILHEYLGNAVSKEDLRLAMDKLKSVAETRDCSVCFSDLISGKGDVLSERRIREIVKEALKVYDADKTGRVDYALETAGGQIISTRCTQRYDAKSRAFKLLGFTLYYESNDPRTVIQGHPIQPGACWSFQGFPGYLVIKLRSFVYVSGFTLEHASKSILPNGEMKSAPRKFNVWGLTNENDAEPILFGNYEFTDSDENLQYFAVQNENITKPYEYVELRIQSNHGQLNYTCLYRFRVHGKPA